MYIFTGLNLKKFNRKLIKIIVYLALSVSRISIFGSIISMFLFRIFLEFAVRSRGFHVSP